VAEKLGYTSPLLYEHFQDKQEILTELAIEGQAALAQQILRDLPADPYLAILAMVDRSWSFVLKNRQLYRLMNGMDGVLIRRDRVTAVAQAAFESATAIVQARLVSACVSDSGAEALFEDLWAVLHGMAILHLDRSAPFDASRAKACVSKLLMGIEEQARRARKKRNDRTPGARQDGRL
jgi:AcrR family transcriptional regulator